MKKEYINPVMDVVIIEVSQQILSESLPLDPTQSVESGWSRELDVDLLDF